MSDRQLRSSMARVVSCRFLRLDCSEDNHPLFRREYVRTNRQRDVKLLRCFPHCCPAHVRRSYCGCSVHVLVTFSTDVSAVPLDDLVVCARFEPSRVAPLWPVGLGVTIDESSRENERRLKLGQHVSLPTSVLPATAAVGTQGGQRDDSVWIRVNKESEDKQRSFPKNTALYVINEGRFPKWFYSYDSSVTRTHREMTHHLVVYVFTPRHTQEPQQSHHFPVIVEARHASPGFLLVSYRRSDASNNPGCVLPAVEKATDNVEGGSSDRLFVSSEELLSASRIVMEQLQRRPQQFLSEPPRRRCASQSTSPQCGHTNDTRGIVHSSTDDEAEDSSTLEDVANTATLSGDEKKDTSLWQYETFARDHYFRDKGQHLLVLWRFLRRLSLADLGLHTGVVDAHVKRYWLRAASALRASQSRPCAELGGIVMSFLISILEDSSNAAAHSMHSSRSRGDVGALPAREETVVRAAVYLFVRALSSRSVQQLLHTALSIARGGAASKRQLHEQFTRFVSDLYDVLSDILRELSSAHGFAPVRQRPAQHNCPIDHPYDSLAALVDDVLSLAYGSIHFGELRPEVSALLLNQQQEKDSLSSALSRAFQVFAVQTQNDTDVSARRQPDMNRLEIRQSSHEAPKTRSLQTSWSRRWLLAPGSLQIVDISSSSPRDMWSDLRLVEVSQFLREFGCVDLWIGDDASNMLLRSVLSLSTDTDRGGLEMLLDGRLHVFQELPSGMSSKIATAGGWIVGDYAARISQDAQALGVDLFAVTTCVGGQMSNADMDGNVVVVRRASLSLTLGQEIRPANCWSDPNSGDLFVFVHGAISECTLRPSTILATGQTSPKNLSAMASGERASLLMGQEWTPLVELHAGYVAVSPFTLRESSEPECS